MKTNNEVVKGVLKTDGTRFVNGEGQEVILTGYGAANWQNVEGFMIGSAPLPKDNFKFILFPGQGKITTPSVGRAAALSASRFVNCADRNIWIPSGTGGRKTTLLKAIFA